MNTKALYAQIGVTVKDILRGGAIIGLIIGWILLLLAATAFGTVSIGERIFVIKDFGLFLTTLLVVICTVTSGSSLLSKEIRQKNIYTVLSKPISRGSYLLSKWIGLWLVGVILNITLHFLLLLFVFIFEGQWAFSLLSNIYFLALEGVVLSAITLLTASLFVTPMLGGVISFLIFIAGRNLDTVVSLSEKIQLTGASKITFLLLQGALPHLYLLNIVNNLTYSEVPLESYFMTAGVYSFSYATACFILSLFVFSKRNFN